MLVDTVANISGYGSAATERRGESDENGGDEVKRGSIGACARRRWSRRSAVVAMSTGTGASLVPNFSSETWRRFDDVGREIGVGRVGAMTMDILNERNSDTVQ